MQALYRCIAGMDVHRMLYVITVLIELADGTVEKHQRSFGGFKRDRRALVAWLLSLESELASLDAYLIDAMTPYADYWHFLQLCRASIKSVPP